VNITEVEERALVRLAQACDEFDGEPTGFCKLMRRSVRPMLDFGSAVAGLGPLTGGVRDLSTLISVDAPSSFIRALRLACFTVPAAKRGEHRVAFEPLFLDPARLPALSPSLRLLAAGRSVFCTHADALTDTRSYFGFLGMPHCRDDAVVSSLRKVIPHVHHALRRVDQAPCLEALSSAENEVLKLMLQGRRNKEIARILGKSTATIRNQLHAIYGKLNVRSRGGAIMHAHRT
jgi:DNA-binding CsgD family transcriptional regulator